MRRTASNRNTARPKPVQKIEVNSKHLGWRLLAAVLLLAFGAAALGYAVMNLVSPSEKGWTEIRANARNINCSGDFVFLYEVGASGRAASSEQKALTVLYTELAETAWQLFSNAEDTGGVRYLNDHPGEEMVVDAALYRAFEQVEASGNRTLYLGPVAELYDSLFFCQDDALAADYDPLLNEELRAFFAEVAGYARDAGAVNVALLGHNTVRLDVSEAYSAFAQREGIRDFLDFCWMRNAFIIDYLADALIEHGYTFGSLSSYEGFARALDSREDGSYAYNLYDRGEQVGAMRYSGARSIVALRGYPLASPDVNRFYVRQDGEIRTAYLDPADGLSRVAAADLTAYSEHVGCAEILLRLAPVYVADSLDWPSLEALSLSGIHSIVCEHHVIRHTDPALVLSNVAEGYET